MKGGSQQIPENSLWEFWQMSPFCIRFSSILGLSSKNLIFSAHRWRAKRLELLLILLLSLRTRLEIIWLNVPTPMFEGENWEWIKLCPWAFDIIKYVLASSRRAPSAFFRNMLRMLCALIKTGFREWHIRRMKHHMLTFKIERSGFFSFLLCLLHFLEWSLNNFFLPLAVF